MDIKFFWIYILWNVKVLINQIKIWIFLNWYLIQKISKIILSEDKIEIKPALIQLKDDIKMLGNFGVQINLHPEIQVQVKINVVAEENIQ